MPYPLNIIDVIQETATWIEKVNSDFEQNLFRTPELSPKCYYHQIPKEDKEAVLYKIVSTRATLLSQAGVPVIPVNELVNYGRLMFFDADCTVNNGAPEEASAYFVDRADTPPWDTWVALGEQLNSIELYKEKLVGNLLIAWGPKSHYYYANEAVDVACLGNFEWPISEKVSSGYGVIKELFSMPPNIVEVVDYWDKYKRAYRMNAVMIEHETNSKKYYKSIIPNRSKADLLISYLRKNIAKWLFNK